MRLLIANPFGSHRRPPRCRWSRSARATARRRSSPSIRRWTAPTSTCSAATSPAATAIVTLIANYLPLQDAYGGPNYFTLDPERRLRHPHRQRRRREGGPDVPFPLPESRFRTCRSTIGPAGNMRTVPVPLITTVPGGDRPGRARSQRLERDRDLHGRAHSRRSAQFGPRARERRGRHGARRCSRSPSTTSATSRFPTTPRTRANHVYNVTHSGLPAGQAVRRPTQGAVRREPRRGVRSREHERRRTRRTASSTSSTTRT